MRSPGAGFHPGAPLPAGGPCHNLRHRLSEEHLAPATPAGTSRSQRAAWPGIARGWAWQDINITCWREEGAMLRIGGTSGA